jgi:hypothetical protein
MTGLFPDRVHFVTPYLENLIYRVLWDKKADFVQIESAFWAFASLSDIPQVGGIGMY